MSDIRIAHRYAKSILDLASDQGQLDAVNNDMQYLQTAFDKSRELYNLIKSPIINKGKKLDVFSKLFSNNISNISQVFLKRVISKGRESIIPEMIQSFQSIYNERQGITDVTLTTIANVSAASMDTIQARMKEIIGVDRQINLHTKTDDSLIGGFILEFEDKRIDASVKHQLENIKKTFSA